MFTSISIPQFSTEEEYIAWYETEVLANMHEGISSHVLHD